MHWAKYIRDIEGGEYRWGACPSHYPTPGLHLDLNGPGCNLAAILHWHTHSDTHYICDSNVLLEDQNVDSAFLSAPSSRSYF